ncbi:hypothetical protein [Campylobacter troglodytis]|uniref:hypothetical protein n=1 Tax=Campylobacter troglodytis TaxID=654363 RepID=UPI00115A7A71|nr:hypothetical protein [Campylobacter troglodytis]TQR53031.1 hypothetical protein DMC01_12305 [Campylobacter troglodytis]
MLSSVTPVIRHLASIYPDLMEAIYRELGPHLRSLFSDLEDNKDKTLIEQIKKIDQEIMQSLHQKSNTDKDLKEFTKEMFANIFNALRDNRNAL